MERLVDGKEIAHHLGISYASVMRWANAGANGQRIPHFVLNTPEDPVLSSGNRKKCKGGQPRQPRHLIRFRISEVEDWLLGRRNGGAT